MTEEEEADLIEFFYEALQDPHTKERILNMRDRGFEPLCFQTSRHSLAGIISMCYTPPHSKLIH